MFDNEIDVEVGTNFLKFDGPIGRFRFFIIQLVYFLVGIAVILVKEFFIPLLRACPVDMYWCLIIVVLIAIYINFVAVCKRLYDITAQWQSAIILGLLLCVLGPIFSPLYFISIIALMVIQGKLLKNLY